MSFLRFIVNLHSIGYFGLTNYFDTNKIAGVYNNVVDLHPLNTIRKIHSANANGKNPPVAEFTNHESRITNY